MRARAALAAAAGALLAGCLAGCGIPTTGVVEAGEPATGVHQDVTLYFVRAQDGALVTVRHRADAQVDAQLAVRLLLRGAGAVETKMLGLTSDLPPTGATVRTQDGTVAVDLAAPVDQVGRTAVDQIVCTVLANRQPTAAADAGPPQVTVTAQGAPLPWRSSGGSCAAVGSWLDKPGGIPTAADPGAVSGR